eukprot:486134-Prorocentrum_minimum.AAC.2
MVDCTIMQTSLEDVGKMRCCAVPVGRRRYLLLQNADTTLLRSLEKSCPRRSGGFNARTHCQPRFKQHDFKY